MKELLKFRLSISTPIPILACASTPELVLHRKGNDRYLFTSSTASSRTITAPSLGILATYTG